MPGSNRGSERAVGARTGINLQLQLLSQVDLFSACSKKELRRIATLATAVEVNEGRALTREGRPGSELFCIRSGSAVVTLRSKELRVLYPGDSFGEMSLISEGPRTATVTAQTPMDVYIIGAPEFATLIEDVPQIGLRILRVLSQRLRELEKSPVS
jgi:CRP/FNR family transcriptional regulator, cyclic AMP receptor protein